MKTLFLSIFLAIGLSGNAQNPAQPDTTIIVAETQTQAPLNFEREKPWKVAVNFNCNFEPQSANGNGGKEIFEPYSLNSDFRKSYYMMETVVSGLKEYTVKGLESSLREKTIASFPSFKNQVGALAQLNRLLYNHYDYSGSTNFTDNFDGLINVLSKNESEKLGVCRHYAFMTSKVAAEAFDLKSSVICGYNHMLVQVRVPGDDRLILIDGVVISDFNGRPLSSKDDVDAATVNQLGQFTTSDVNIDPERNIVAYLNTRNNFSGFWNQLQNWNSDDRQNDFFFGKGGLSLFSHINAKGALYGTMERGKWGLESYYVLDNNQYSSFLKGMQGLNFAGQLPFSSKNKKWRETVFVNIGLYRAMLSVQSDSARTKPIRIEPLIEPQIEPRIEPWENPGGIIMAKGATKNESQSDINDSTEIGTRPNAYGLQISLNHYLEYSLTPHLATGVISILNANREIAREGGSTHGVLTGYWFVSPFVSYSLPGNRLKLIGGVEVTNTLALPSLWRFTAIPWAQIMWQKKNFSSSLRCEYQPASFRVDHIATWQMDFGQIQVRTFAEKYTAEFKTTNLFHDAFGTEIGIGRRIKNIGIMKISVTGLTDNCGSKNLFLNLGVKF